MKNRPLRTASLLAVALILTALLSLHVYADDSNVTATGKLGDDLTWTLYESGTLEVEGSGDAYDNTGGSPFLQYMANIKEVILPEGMTSIGSYTFWACSSMESIRIPGSLERIGENAFYYCTSLSSIELPANLEALDATAFSECTNLSSISTAPDSKYFKAVDNVLFTADMKELVFYPRGLSASSYTIPEGVETVGERAFFSNRVLTSIVFPETLKTIDEYAFCGCTVLKEIDLPDSVSSMGQYSFSQCGSLEHISLPANLTEISDYTFYNSGNARNTYTLTFPEGIIRIGDHAFDSYRDMSEIVLPETLTEIGTSAFSQSKITAINFPSSLTSIGNMAFYKCENLKMLDIPASVSSLGAQTFYYTNSNERKVIVRNPDCSLSEGFIDWKKDSAEPPVFYGYINSTVHKYASENEYEFIALDQIETPPEISLSPDTFTYDGTPKSPSVTVRVNDQTLEESFYTVSGAENTDAGEYTVTVTLKNGLVGKATAKYTIKPAEVTPDDPPVVTPDDPPAVTPDDPPAADHDVTPEIILSGKTFTYNGKVQSPSVTVRIKGKTLGSSYYTVSGARHTNAGKYTVTVTLKNGFSGKGTAKYTIRPAKVTPAVMLSAKSLSYNGKVRSPSVTVRVKGKKLKSSEYTVKGLKKKLPGKYTVTVSLKGNYKGTASVKYRIQLKRISITKAKAMKGQFYIRWKKLPVTQKKLVDGYQVHYSSRKDFSKRVSRISHNAADKEYYSKDGLKSGKTYYVRVRSFKKIKGKRYYSPWSSVEKIRIK